MAKESFLLYTSIYEPIKELTDEQLGRLFRAILLYNLEQPHEVDADLMMAFKFIKQQEDANNKRYQEMVEKRSMAGKKGGAPKGNKNASKKNKTSKTSKTSLFDDEYEYVNDNENEINGEKKEYIKKKAPTFVPPTLEEVKEYVAEKGLKMDAEHFYDHYTSNGWKVSGRTMMKDWKAAARSWAKNEEKFKGRTPHGTSVGERAYNMLHFASEGHPEIWIEEEKKFKELQKYM